MAPVRRSVTPLPVEPTEPKKPGRKLGQRPSAAVAAERKALGIKRHAEKATPEEIAAEAGVALETVKGWMRDKVAFPPHPPEPASEPAPVDPRVEMAATLRAEGKTFGEIVKATGMTRGQLSWIMKQDRVRFPIKDHSAATRAVAARRRSGVEQLVPAASAPPSAVDEAPASVDAAPASTPAQADPVDASPSSAPHADDGDEADPFPTADGRPAKADSFRPLRGVAPIAFGATTGQTCKWPVHPAGERETAVALHSCGCPTTMATRPYCAAHAEIGFNAALPRRQKQPFHLDRGRNGAGVQRSGAAWAH